MPDIPDECWSRVKERLRAELGEAIYTSWFARMELESQDLETARISVPTRFLKSWIQSHYSEKLLACWQAERATVRRIDLSVRSAATRTPPPCAAAPAEAPAESGTEPTPPMDLLDRFRRTFSQQEDPDGPINTDRPTFTPANTVVPRGRLQFESGWTYSA